MNETYWDALMEAAGRVGTEEGKNAASWWEQDTVGGNAQKARETAEMVLKGLDEGDPAVYDRLPSPDLSGQWADERTPGTLYVDATHGTEYPLASEVPDEVMMEMCDAYETAFRVAVEDMVSFYCHQVLDPTE